MVILSATLCDSAPGLKTLSVSFHRAYRGWGDPDLHVMRCPCLRTCAAEVSAPEATFRRPQTQSAAVTVHPLSAADVVRLAASDPRQVLLENDRIVGARLPFPAGGEAVERAGLGRIENRATAGFGTGRQQ